MVKESYPEAQKNAMPTHTESKKLPYTPQQMFDLVADVGKYPEFLPWTGAARIRSDVDQGDHRVMDADRAGGKMVSVKAGKEYRAEIGDSVSFAVPTDICHIFDRSTGERI